MIKILFSVVLSLLFQIGCSKLSNPQNKPLNQAPPAYNSDELIVDLSQISKISDVTLKNMNKSITEVLLYNKLLFKELKKIELPEGVASGLLAIQKLNILESSAGSLMTKFMDTPGYFFRQWLEEISDTKIICEHHELPIISNEGSHMFLSTIKLKFDSESECQKVIEPYIQKIKALKALALATYTESRIGYQISVALYEDARSDFFALKGSTITTGKIPEDFTFSNKWNYKILLNNHEQFETGFYSFVNIKNDEFMVPEESYLEFKKFVVDLQSKFIQSSEYMLGNEKLLSSVLKNQLGQVQYLLDFLNSNK